MDKLLIATNNAHKVSEIKAILGEYCESIYCLLDLGLNINPEENGKTFEDNAIIKAREAFNATGLASLADDSGICAYALSGAPGVYSARFAGENATDTQNNQKLKKYLSGFEETERGVYYACSIALCLPKGGILTSYGECRGVFISEPKGNNGFGYDPHFFLPEYNMTMAELPPEIKNTISHRFLALKDMKRQLELYKL